MSAKLLAHRPTCNDGHVHIEPTWTIAWLIATGKQSRSLSHKCYWEATTPVTYADRRLGRHTADNARKRNKEMQPGKWNAVNAADNKIISCIANQALRLCLGAFRTSPTTSLQILCHKPPLELRRNELALKYTLKLQANPSNPTFNTIFIDKPSRLFAIKHTVIPPLSIRISSLLNLINSINTSIARNRISPTLPWLLPNPVVNFHLSQHSFKASAPPDTYKLKLWT